MYFKNLIKSFIIRCTATKRVTSWARATQLILKCCSGGERNELGPGNTAHFEMLQRWRAVGNTVSDLTGPRFEPQIFRFKDERVTARPTGHENVFLR